MAPIPAPTPRVQSLPLLRASLFISGLLVGGIVVFARRQPTWTGAQSWPAAFSYVLMAVAAIAALAAFVVRGRLATEADPQRRVGMLVLGWAFAEAPALIGGLLFLFTGKSQWYFLGVLVMLVLFSLLPIEQTR